MAVKIRFAQGLNVGNVGQALVGSTGVTVVASDGNAAPGTVSHYRWTWIDVPTSSALVLGFITEGPASAITFVPDVAGDYHLLVEAFTTGGFKTTDRRVFRVELASGRALPAFDAEADALNFGGQTRGWKPDMEEWLLYLNSLVSPGQSSAGAQGTMQVAGSIPGTFAGATGVLGGANYVSIGTGSLPTSGFLRFSSGASTTLISGHNGSVAAPILVQGTAGVLNFGDQNAWSINFFAYQFAVWSRSADGILYGGTGSAQMFSWNGNGVQVGGAPSFGGGTYVLGLRAATVLPSTNPSGTDVIYVDSTDDYALKYRKPSGQIVKLDAFADAFDPSTNGFRLSSFSNNPVPLTDLGNFLNLYLTPYKSGAIALKTAGASGRWVMRVSGQIVLVLTGLTSGKNYDVFVYWNGSAIAMELSAAWTNDTTRADAIQRVDGVWTKTSDVTRRYVGTIRMTSGGCQDTATQRYVFNADNQVPRTLYVQDTTASWTYNVAAWRQVRATATNKVEAVFGLPAIVSGSTMLMWNGASGTGVAMYSGIGLDSTTALATGCQLQGLLQPTLAAQSWWTGGSVYDAVIDYGYHAFNWIELSHATGMTGMGTVGFMQSHLRLRIDM